MIHGPMNTKFLTNDVKNVLQSTCKFSIVVRRDKHFKIPVPNLKASGQIKMFLVLDAFDELRTAITSFVTSLC